jgi:hypothetical protein
MSSDRSIIGFYNVFLNNNYKSIFAVWMRKDWNSPAVFTTL